MNKILLNHLIKNFLKTILYVVLIIYSFGIILNLFEEIEFFKNIEVNFLMPLMLTSIIVPSIILKLLPFIIFIASIWFIVKIKNNKDLLTLKVYGYSNIRIFFILAITSFVLGWLTLVIANPITSSMVKYYEKIKSNYARDIDHLISYNKNGLWIKENIENNTRIITAKKPDKFNLKDVTIFHLDQDYVLKEKIVSSKVDIETNEWLLNDVIIYRFKDGIFKEKRLNNYSINSTYNFEKINSLFINLDTILFIDLVLKYKKLIETGYNSSFLDESLHSMLSLPFFLFLMTSIASILGMHTLKRSNNYKHILVGLVVTVFVYYFKDLSIALGKTDRIPLILSVWAPVIALSLFTFIGVLQINEK